MRFKDKKNIYADELIFYVKEEQLHNPCGFVTDLGPGKAPAPL